MSEEPPTYSCNCLPVVESEYGDVSDQSPSEAIIEAVAAAADADPLELSPLYEYIDPDALDALLDQEGGTADLLVRIEIETWNIFIRGDGKICVCDNTRTTEPHPVFESSTA